MPEFQLIEMEEVMTKFKPHLPDWLNEKFKFMVDKNVRLFSGSIMNKISKCVKDTSRCVQLFADLRERYEVTGKKGARPLSSVEYDILYNVLAHSHRVTE